MSQFLFLSYEQLNEYVNIAVIVRNVAIIDTLKKVYEFYWL